MSIAIPSSTDEHNLEQQFDRDQVSITLNGQELQNLWNVAYWEAGMQAV